jgi:hypothetical protein
MTQFTCKGVKQINNRISLNMTFTFTIRISRRFSSAHEFQMGNFQKYWSQNVGQEILLYFIFFTGGRFWKLTGGTEGTLKIGRKMLPPEGSHVWICDRHIVARNHWDQTWGYVRMLSLGQDLGERYGLKKGKSGRLPKSLHIHFVFKHFFPTLLHVPLPFTKQTCCSRILKMMQ